MSRTTRWMRSHPIKASGAIALALIGALVVGVALGSSSGNLPSVAPQEGAGASASAGTGDGSATAVATAAPGDAAATSSAGVDFGAGLPRLASSPFAATTDPEVFAASVIAASGYDYTGSQPADAAAERERIGEAWRSGMAPEDGPLGPELGKIYRDSVSASIDTDKLAYRISAKEKDDVDVLGVRATDNSEIRSQVGNHAYLTVINNRATLHALTARARIRVELQPVRDNSGFASTYETQISMIIQCDPAIEDGQCRLVGMTGGGAQ